MLRQKWRDGTYFDVANFGLGIFLFLSPWIFGFTSGLAKHTSWMAGVAISVLAFFAIVEYFESEEWINLVIGLWVAVCGWIIGFGTDTGARRVHLLIGLAVAALAATELWRRHAPHAGRDINSTFDRADRR